MQTYIVRYTRPTNSTGTEYVTLTLTGEEAAVVNYLQTNVEPVAEKDATTLSAYLAAAREIMEEEGGSALWDISSNGEQLEQFVNDYMWKDEWEFTQEGDSHVTEAVSV